MTRHAKSDPLSPALPDYRLRRAIVKAVGYGQVANGDVIEKLKAEIERYGQEKVRDVAGDLLDYEPIGGKHYCRIKPELHVYCRMLLGPMPSEWDDWWRNADGTERKGKPKDWPPKLPGAATPVPTPTQALPAVSEYESLTDEQLAAALGERRWRAKSRNASARKAREELPAIEAEFARRGVPLPEERTPVNFDRDECAKRLASLTDQQLLQTLDKVHSLIGKHGPRSWLGRRSRQELELVELEYGRRGQAMPVAPPSAAGPPWTERTDRPSQTDVER